MIQYKSESRPNDILVVHVKGDLDQYTHQDFFDYIVQDIEEGKTRIVIDCSGISHVSSVGIGTLMRLHARISKLGGDVKLAALQGSVAQLLKLTFIDRIIDLHEDVEMACGAFD